MISDHVPRQQLEDDPLLRVDEVAAMLRLSRSAVYNLIWRGALPYVNLASGNRLAPRVRLSDLKEFLNVRSRRGPGNSGR